MARTRPIKRGALYRRHRALGALMEDYLGWELAAQFGAPEEEFRHVRRAVGLAERSWLVKIEIKGEAAQVEWETSDRLGLWFLARGHWLVTCEPADRELGWRAASLLARRSPCLRLTDVSSAQATLQLAGPRSRDVLRRLTSLDVSESALPDRSCAMTGLAHVPATILRQDLRRTPAYLLLVGGEYGEYVWDAIMHAGHDFDIAPLGRKALEILTDDARSAEESEPPTTGTD